ncbi:MAG: sulfatase [Bacteroidetes bacterium]|nr:sulfatase [Bacteroidota bacterium]
MQYNSIISFMQIMRIFLCLMLLGIVSISVLQAQKQQRPNIILILTDDLGWSCFSSRMDDRLPDSKSDYYETPNIDRLAAQSLRFTRGYAPDPICTPSRRSIQFGQTSIRQGDESFPAAYAPAESRYKAIPQVLKSIDSRYKAAHFGKWDLRAKITPEQLGYDESDGDTGNKNGDISSDREEKWSQFFITDNPKQIDSITYRSIRFMQAQVKTKTPFYLQVSHYATHVNFETRKESYERFSRKPVGNKHNNPAWAGMINDLDAAIGELLKSVDALGIANNTYIFLMADNGAVEFIPPVRNRLDPPSSFTTQMRNYPLRGGKWTLYEGGIRVPFMVRGPGISGGAQTDIPVAGWDLLPTITELAGQTVQQAPADRDGVSLAALLRNGGKGSLHRTADDFYFHRYNNGYPHSAIISGDYKLIKFWKTKKIELYNLHNDIGELTDIASREPGKVKELEAKLLRYINQVNPTLAKTY